MLALVSIILLTTVVFANVVHGGFLAWDDDIEITRNAHIQELSAPNVKWMFTDTAQTMRYIPLAWLNWALLRSFFGPDPRWFHVETLALHVANALLFFAFLTWVLRLPAVAGGGLAPNHVRWIAVLAALLWAVHPLRSEVVAWATQERFAQSLFFFLAALLAYLRFETARDGWKRRILYGATIVLGVLSALSYPTGSLLFGVLLVMDAYPLRRLSSRSRVSDRRSVFLEKLPFLLVPVIVWIPTLKGRLEAGGFYEKPPSLQEFGLAARAMQAFYVWAYYAWRPLYPLHLSPIYARLIHFRPTELCFVVSLAVVLALTLGSLRAARSRPALTALWTCHLFLLIPMLGFFETPHYTSDRYSYTQGLLWSLFLAGGLAALAKRGLTRAFAACCVVSGGIVLALGALTIRQNLIWRDSVTLFQYTIRSLEPDSPRPDLHSRLGLAYLDRGGDMDDEAALREILAYPLPVDAMVSVGWTFLNKGKPDKAAAVFTKGAESPLLQSEAESSRAPLYNGLGVAQARRGALGPAETALTEAVRLDPRYLEARSNLGQCLIAERKYDRAVAELRALVSLSRDDPRAQQLLQRAEEGLRASPVAR